MVTNLCIWSYFNLKSRENRPFVPLLLFRGGNHLTTFTLSHTEKLERHSKSKKTKKFYNVNDKNRDSRLRSMCRHDQTHHLNRNGNHGPFVFTYSTFNGPFNQPAILGSPLEYIKSSTCPPRTPTERRRRCEIGMCHTHAFKTAYSICVRYLSR